MSSINTIIDNLRMSLTKDLSNISQSSELRMVENKYLKTELRALYNSIRLAKTDVEKRQIGEEINRFKNLVQQEIAAFKASITRLTEQEAQLPPYDISIRKNNIRRGMVHPLNKLYNDIERVLLNMGFSVVYGPEIELDENNFGKLNMPPHHPARDMQDTFYIKNQSGTLLRSHTSSVQIRIMENNSPPIRVISPGVVYRVDDISPQHTPMFHQIEGLLVDKNVSFSDLKGVLTNLMQTIFGADIKLRFRPSYYPYTEPSAAVDISCIICNQAGCRTCNQTGWITMLGSGMVHPNVFKAVGYDPSIYSGFAFGLGLNRLALVYYQLPEIRILYENDILLYDQLRG